MLNPSPTHREQAMADQQTSRTKPRPSRAVNAFKPLGRRAALRRLVSSLEVPLTASGSGDTGKITLGLPLSGIAN